MCIDSWMTRTVPGCPRCQGWGRSCCPPCPRPSPPSPLGSHLLLVSWCLGVNWPPSGRKTWVNPPGSLGNWSHPLPLVSAWSAVDYSQRAAAALSSLDQLSAAWCAACRGEGMRCEAGCCPVLGAELALQSQCHVNLKRRMTNKNLCRN